MSLEDDYEQEKIAIFDIKTESIIASSSSRLIPNKSFLLRCKKLEPEILDLFKISKSSGTSCKFKSLNLIITQL
jgi:hypothetical protein